METNDVTTELVWRDFKKGLDGFIRSKVRDRDEAQDILQEVFIKVHLNLHSLRSEDSLASWTYQIARNTIQNYYRKKKLLEVVGKTDIAADEKEPDMTEFNRCMLPFIRKLPEKYRKAIILTDLKKMDQVQLAKKLNISYSGAKSRVQRARQLLHSYFTECCTILSDKYGNIISHEPRGKCSCAA